MNGYDIIIIITFKMLNGVTITNTKCEEIGNGRKIYYPWRQYKL